MPDENEYTNLDEVLKGAEEQEKKLTITVVPATDDKGTPGYKVILDGYCTLEMMEYAAEVLLGSIIDKVEKHK